MVMQLKKLEQMGIKKALKALEHSISSNYQGIFEQSEYSNKTRNEQHQQKSLTSIFPENYKPAPFDYDKYE